MGIELSVIEVGGVRVEVARKRIKNLNLSVHPPEGRVRVSAPMRLGDEAVRLAVASKLAWIQDKQKAFAERPRQPPREMVTGEDHFFLGRRYRLRVLEENGPCRVSIEGDSEDSELTIRVRPGAGREKRERVLDDWYRCRMKELVPELVAKWQPIMGVDVADWGVKKMKTRWGSCNIRDRRIWLNLELAKKPLHCLEYVVVHEMAHLLERLHNDRFKSLMDGFMPQWRTHKNELDEAAIPHEERAGAEDSRGVS